MSVDLEAENRRLRAELAEARRANEILKKASLDSNRQGNTLSFLAAFIDENRHEFGITPIVRAQKGTAALIAVSSYYAYKLRVPSARALRDRELIVVI